MAAFPRMYGSVTMNTAYFPYGVFSATRLQRKSGQPSGQARRACLRAQLGIFVSSKMPAFLRIAPGNAHLRGGPPSGTCASLRLFTVQEARFHIRA